MAVCGAQNAIDANIKGRIAAARALVPSGCLKNSRAVITAAVFIPNPTVPAISHL